MRVLNTLFSKQAYKPFPPINIYMRCAVILALASWHEYVCVTVELEHSVVLSRVAARHPSCLGRQRVSRFRVS